MVDRLSKYVHFIAIAHPFSAKSIALVFVKEIDRLHGYTRSIVSNRDKIFLSHYYSQMFRLQGTQLKSSSAYDPQTVELMKIEQLLGKTLVLFLRREVKDVDGVAAKGKHWYDTTFHASVNITPFQVVYELPPPPLVSYGE